MADPFSLLLLALFAGAGKGGAVSPSSPSVPPLRLSQPKPRARPAPPREIELAPDVVVPASLTDTTFPGPRWEKHIPVTEDVARRAAELLPALWARGEGTGIVERLGDRLVGFLSERHGDKKGVSAWRLKAGTIVPKAAPAPAPRPPAPRPVAPAPALPARTKKRRKKAAPAPPVAAPAPAPMPPPPKPKKRRKKPTPLPVSKQPEALPPPPPPEQDESGYPFPLRPDKPVLMQGSSGSDVVELQKLLGITGTLGFFGPMTVERLEKYQEDNGLPVDGKAGEVTWGSLLA